MLTPLVWGRGSLTPPIVPTFASKGFEAGLCCVVPPVHYDEALVLKDVEAATPAELTALLRHAVFRLLIGLATCRRAAVLLADTEGRT